MRRPNTESGQHDFIGHAFSARLGYKWLGFGTQKQIGVSSLLVQTQAMFSVLQSVGSKPNSGLPTGTKFHPKPLFWQHPPEEFPMGKGILMWLIGIPIPIILLLLLFWR